ncbi:MAG: DUF4126 domain-containing protein [Acidobacteria bacterium]|nr:DUF4126 domain-containing protein [Acidobacteriota bacterium]
MEILLSVGLGVGLAAACGFRIFLPVLVMGLAARAGFLELTENFEWIAGSPALLTVAVAVTCEIVAYYIPWFDNLLDMVAMPAAVATGILVGAANIETTMPFLDWSLAAVAGGGSAAVAQMGTTLLRGASTAATAGLGNPAVSTAENGAAIGMSVLAIVVPVMALASVLILVILVVAGVRRGFRRRRAAS